MPPHTASYFHISPADLVVLRHNYPQQDGKLGRVFRRCFEHIWLSVIAGALPQYTPTDSHMYYYFGLICIIPYTPKLSKSFALSIAAGVCQCLIWILLGAQLDHAIFIGGIQSWIISCYVNPKRLLQYVAAFWLVILCANLSRTIQLPSFLVLSMLPISFITVSAAVLFCMKGLPQQEQARIWQQTADETSAALLRQIDSPHIPDAIAVHLNALFHALEQGIRAVPERRKEQLELLIACRRFAETLEHTDWAAMEKNTQKTAELIKFAHFLHKIFDPEGFRQWQASQKTAKKDSKPNTATPQNTPAIPHETADAPAVADPIMADAATSPGDTPTSPQETTDAAATDTATPFAPYFRSCQNLEKKVALLPPTAAEHAVAICNSTLRILHCMTTDPDDVPSGERFLKRYLKAVHSIADQHITLAANADGNQNIQHALQQSEQTLAKLQTAFARQHQHLLQNDIIHYTAELKALDTLLDLNTA